MSARSSPSAPSTFDRTQSSPPGGLRVGIAGSLLGRHGTHAGAHAAAFSAAQAQLAQAGANVWLGDDASDPEQAVVLARHFVAQGAQAVLGHFNSACARAAWPIYRAADVVLLLPAATDPQLATGPGLYRLCGNDHTQARTLLKWVREQQPTRHAVAVRVDRSDYAERLLCALHKAWGAEHLTVLDWHAEATRPSAVEVVCALARNACEVVRRPGFGAGRQALAFTDEASVAEFEHAAARCSTPCWVATPTPSFEQLLLWGANRLLDWRRQAAAGQGLAHWLNHHGGFSPQGEAEHGAWRMRCIASVHTAPVSFPSLHHTLHGSQELT